MIVIDSRQMTIPEDERFVGFFGDNKFTTKEFVIMGVSESDNNYTLYLTFDDNKIIDVALDSKTESDSTTLVWNILDNHIVKSGLIKAQIKVQGSGDDVYYTSSDYFYACKSLPFEGDIGESGYTDIYDLDEKISELIESQLDSVHEDLVPKTRKVAGISLEKDITAVNLGAKFVLNLMDGFIPSIDTSGFEGQICIEGDNIYVLTSIVKSYDGPGGTKYNWVKLMPEHLVKNNYLRKISLITSVDANSTNDQIPSAKLFYDTVGTINSALDELHTYAQSLISGGATE